MSGLSCRLIQCLILTIGTLSLLVIHNSLVHKIEKYQLNLKSEYPVISIILDIQDTDKKSEIILAGYVQDDLPVYQTVESLNLFYPDKSFNISELTLFYNYTLAWMQYPLIEYVTPCLIATGIIQLWIGFELLVIVIYTLVKKMIKLGGKK